MWVSDGFMLPVVSVWFLVGVLTQFLGSFAFVLWDVFFQYFIKLSAAERKGIKGDRNEGKCVQNKLKHHAKCLKTCSKTIKTD